MLLKVRRLQTKANNEKPAHNAPISVKLVSEAFRHKETSSNTKENPKKVTYKTLYHNVSHRSNTTQHLSVNVYNNTAIKFYGTCLINNKGIKNNFVRRSPQGRGVLCVYIIYSLITYSLFVFVLIYVSDDITCTLNAVNYEINLSFRGKNSMLNKPQIKSQTRKSLS